MYAESLSPSNRRTFLRSGLTVAAVSAVQPWSGTAAHAAEDTVRRRRPFIAYSKGSFFRSRVRGAPVDRRATASFHRFMARHPEQKDIAYPMIRGLDGNEWGTAFARGLPRHPVWRLTGNVPSEVADLKRKGFHAPAWFGDMLTGTSDSPFVVIDRGRGQSVWAHGAKVVGRRTIRVESAGRYMHRSNGLDQRNRRSNNERNFRSRGAIPDAMAIRRSLVDYGIRHGTGLGHVLHMFLVETDSSAGFCHPMVGEEGEKYGWGAQGTRIAIAPGVDLTRRGLSPAGLVIARTLQQHGCYIGDNSGSSSGLKAQQATRHRDPWKGMRINQDSLAGLRWKDFVVLPKGWQ